MVFSTSKVKSYFSLKSKSIPLMKSCVVYEFSCLGDPSSQYIGKTKRRLQQQIDEHENNPPAINEHLHNCSRCNSEIDQQFKIMYKGIADYEISIVEALKIKDRQPKINRSAEYNGVSYLLKIFN